MKFRGYYREALVLKYTPGVWHLQFQRGGAVWIRWVGRPGRQLDRAWGINTSFKYRAGSTKLCYWPARFNAGYMIRFRACYTPLNLLEVFIYTYSSKYDFGRSKMGWSLIGGASRIGTEFSWITVGNYVSWGDEGLRDVGGWSFGAIEDEREG